jgi:hypothetical protein
MSTQVRNDLDYIKTEIELKIKELTWLMDCEEVLLKIAAGDIRDSNTICKCV